mmetsp:Transcript_25781/g.40237  ORF Transcript_25781/g.40237 Transcript_25781/m.40237 type:complete len:223 (-) Transcript_25781:30-698(-)
MIFSAILSLSADPSIGKIDKDSLTQQTLMELLIEPLTPKHKIVTICDDDSLPTINKWQGLHINGYGEVTQIDWISCGLCGEFLVQWLPPSLQMLSVMHNLLYGPLDLTCLPDRMRRCNVRQNRLNGEIDLTHLPLTMLSLNVSYNQLVGSVDLTRLPEKIQDLFLNNNAFSGVAAFDQLPESLKTLNVMQTSLEGTVVLDRKRTVTIVESKVQLVADTTAKK